MKRCITARFYLLSVLVPTLGFSCVAASPGWIATTSRELSYPREEFLTGLGVSPEDKNMPAAEKLSYARNMAYRNLAASLQVEISSEDRLHRLSSMVGNDEDIMEEFKSTIVAKSDINLDGVEFEEHTGKSSEAASALAFLERARARDHYRRKFARQLGLLVKMQTEANRLLASGDRSAARDAYLKCEQLVREVEQIIVVRELLGDATPIPDTALQTVVDVKNESRRVWQTQAETMQEAAEQLALKLSAYKPAAGRVQVNAFMLDDSYQYSQFSGRFRALLENELQKRTGMKPLLLSELDFTPHSAGVARHRLAANKADLLISGSYFLKESEGLVSLHVRLSDAAKGEIIASAETSMKMAAAGELQLKPRNYLEVLQDRRVFAKDEIAGGGLNLEVWTNRGREGLVLEDEDELNVFVRVNRPCYVRFIYHLSNGARVVPDELYMNYFISTEMVNRPVKLPHDFVVAAPFGSETIQFMASTEKLPALKLVPKVFEGEEYEVLSDSLEENNAKHRGIKTKDKVEFAEARVALTTVPK